ncbi:RDD family protein [Microbacterium sp. CFH 31415]|uniref:RDD family protein n=1 Tax=Microbacterium sp. CFH 31415 TaxID=2921732 RepID=UPI001F136869|nr:RDD family protein [Microbacterium sp. CFH 31415]MCH6230718.1 RDD family protein [Microbacterium sp. CFH 31415]
MTARPPLALVAAPPGRRIAAYVIDALVATAVGTAAAAVAFAVALSLGAVGDARTLALAVGVATVAAWMSLLAWSIVYTAMQGAHGSVGQRALGLRLLDAGAPVAIGFWRALWRNVVWSASCAIVVGWFTPLFDASPRRQGWHDRAAGALVIDVRGADAAAATATAAALATFPAVSAGRPWFLDDIVIPPKPAPPVAPAPEAMAPAPVAPAAVAAPAPVVASAPAMTLTAVPGTVAVAEASAPPPAVIPQAPATRPVTLPSADQARSLTVPPPAPPAPMFDDPVLAVLTWDDGVRMAVYGRTRYGRNPAVEPGIVSVPVRDETLSLSKTHFEIGGVASGPWVADHHSTNGTVLVRDGERQPLVPGLRIGLRDGDLLELGDRIASVGVPR